MCKEPRPPEPSTPPHPPLPPANNPLEQAQKDGAEEREENPGYQ